MKKIFLVTLLCFVTLALGRPEAGFVYNELKHLHESGLVRTIDDASITQQQLPEVEITKKFTDAANRNNYGIFAGGGGVGGGIQSIQGAGGYTTDLQEEELTKEKPPQPTQSFLQFTQQNQQQNQPHPTLLQTNFDSYKNIYESYNDIASSGYAYPSVVQKHVYVHVPPKDFEDEHEIQQSRVHYQAGLKQKHYKIIFIKAPSVGSARPQVIAPPPVQNEEKTIIYVLHKKPEHVQDIVIPTAAPTKPSKPEVFFIKYKTIQKEDERPVYGPPPQSTPSDPSLSSQLLPSNAPRNNPIAEVDEYLNQLQNQQITNNDNEHLTASIQDASNIVDEKSPLPYATVPQPSPPTLLHTSLANFQQNQHQVIVAPPPTAPASNQQYLVQEVGPIGNVPTPTTGQYGPPNRF